MADHRLVHCCHTPARRRHAVDRRLRHQLFVALLSGQKPVGGTKTDRCSLMNLVENPNDKTIVRSTIELTRNTDRKSMTCSVETQAKPDRPREPGRDPATGHVIRTPIPADMREKWFQESKSARDSVISGRAGCDCRRGCWRAGLRRHRLTGGKAAVRARYMLHVSVSSAIRSNRK